MEPAILKVAIRGGEVRVVNARIEFEHSRGSGAYAPFENSEDPEAFAGAMIATLPDDEKVTDVVFAVLEIVSRVLTPAVRRWLDSRGLQQAPLRSCFNTMPVSREDRSVRHLKEIWWVIDHGMTRMRLDYSVYTQRPWGYTIWEAGALPPLSRAYSVESLTDLDP